MRKTHALVGHRIVKVYRKPEEVEFGARLYEK
jgi:hypothetical protein